MQNAEVFVNPRRGRATLAADDELECFFSELVGRAEIDLVAHSCTVTRAFADSKPLGLTRLFDGTRVE